MTPGRLATSADDFRALNGERRAELRDKYDEVARCTDEVAFGNADLFGGSFTDSTP
jgi:hypothetical protein